MSLDPLDPPTIDPAQDIEPEEERVISLEGQFMGVEYGCKGSDFILCIAVPEEERYRLSEFWNGLALVTLERPE